MDKLIETIDTAFACFLLYNRFIMFTKVKRMDAQVNYKFCWCSTQHVQIINHLILPRGWPRMPISECTKAMTKYRSKREGRRLHARQMPSEHIAAEGSHNQHHHPDICVLLPRGKERGMPMRQGPPVLI